MLPLHITADTAPSHPCPPHPTSQKRHKPAIINCEFAGFIQILSLKKKHLKTQTEITTKQIGTCYYCAQKYWT